MFNKVRRAEVVKGRWKEELSVLLLCQIGRYDRAAVNLVRHQLIFECFVYLPGNLTADEEESILSMQKANTRRKQDVQIGDMLPETKVLLDAFYKPYNEQLARMLEDNSYLWNDGWS